LNNLCSLLNPSSPNHLTIVSIILVAHNLIGTGFFKANIYEIFGITSLFMKSKTQ